MAVQKEEVIVDIKVDNKQAVKALSDQEKQTKKNTKATENSAEATDEMTGALSSMLGELGIMPAALGKANSGTKLLSKGFGTLKGAIIATGIGALILGLTALFAWFNRTAKGQEKLAIITATLGEVFNQIIGLIEPLGEAIFNAFDNPKEAVINLWEAIKTNIVNRVKGLGILFSALKKVITSTFSGNFDEAKEGLKDMAVATVQLSTGLDEIQQNNVMQSLADTTAQIVKNVRESTQIQKEANALRRDQIAFITKEAELTRDISEARRIAEDSTKSTTEQLAGIVEAERLTNELIDSRRDLLAAELDQLLRKDGLASNTLEDYEAEEQLKRRIIDLDKQANDQIRGLSRRRTTLANTLEKENELKAKGGEIDQGLIDKENERTLKAEEKLVLAEEKAAEQRANALSNAQLQADALLLIEEARLERSLELAKGNEAEIELAVFDSSQRKLAIEKDAADSRKSISDEFTQSQIDLNNSIVDATLKGLDIIKGDSKVLALAQMAINSAVGIAKTIANVGLPAAIPFIATQALLIGTQIANIKKASRGMMIEGNSHANGGTIVGTPQGIIEAEGGEFIMNKNSTAMYKQELSAISRAGGGIAIAERGFLVGESSQRSGLATLGNDLSKSISQSRAVLVTEDLQAVQSRVAVTEQIATL